MNERLIRRLLRAAAWISIAGVLLGAVIEWTAILKARDAADALTRTRLLDGALGASVFWGMLWIGLPVGAAAFWRHIGWAERVLAVLLPLGMALGVVVAWTMRGA